MVDPRDREPPVVANRVTGDVRGPAVQAGLISGGIHYHDHRPDQTPASARVITSQLFGLTQVVGRADLLEKLSGLFHGEVRTPSSRPVLRVLSGIGGIGKSSVARAYGTENQDRYSLIWWLRAEEPTLVIDDFRSLLDVLGVPDVQRLEQPIQFAHVMLANWPGRWLLIFDNAPVQSSLRGLVPPTGQGDIIVTSRSSSWTDARIVLTVPPLPVDVAGSLLREISRDENEAEARTLDD
jgi:hypothetical protein